MVSAPYKDTQPLAMTKERIEAACNYVRFYLTEAINDADYAPPELSDFPGGSCELASYWLGILLKRIGFENIQVCNGSRHLSHEDQPKNHVWLYIEDCFYVDITGDQFDNCNSPIVVEELLPNYLSDFKPFRIYPLEEADSICQRDANYNKIWLDLNNRLGNG